MCWLDLANFDFPLPTKPFFPAINSQLTTSHDQTINDGQSFEMKEDDLKKIVHFVSEFLNLTDSWLLPW